MNTDAEKEVLRALEKDLRTAVCVDDILHTLGKAALLLPPAKSKEFKDKAEDRLEMFKWVRERIRNFVGQFMGGEPGVEAAAKHSMDLLVQIFLLGYDSRKLEEEEGASSDA